MNIQASRSMTAMRFASEGGKPRRSPPTHPAEMLIRIKALPDAYHSVLYFTKNEAARKITLYVHTHPGNREDVRELEEDLMAELRAFNPGWEVNSKLFEERPSNAIVIQE